MTKMTFKITVEIPDELARQYLSRNRDGSRHYSSELIADEIFNVRYGIKIIQIKEVR